MWPHDVTFNPEAHHRRSIRLRGYDYSKPGAYFVTICVKNRACILSTIDDRIGAGLVPARLSLTDIGKIVENCWKGISKRFPHVCVDDYIIMPNHVHGIVIITPGLSKNPNKRAGTSPAPTLGDIVRVFKSTSAIDYLAYIKNRNLNATRRLWQRNYYEHIVRNDHDFDNIKKYIRNNPINWAMDAENPANNPS